MRGSRGGENTDANRRLAMLWGDDDLIRDPVGSTYSPEKQVQTTVKDQIEDENSLYNYYCELIAIRHKYPAIARGDYRAVDCGEKNLGGFIVEYDGEKIGIFHNNSAIDSLSFDLSKLDGDTFKNICDSIGTGEGTIKGTTLTLPPQTSVVVN